MVVMKEKLMELLLRVNPSIDPESVDTFHVTIGDNVNFRRVADVCAYLSSQGIPD